MVDKLKAGATFDQLAVDSGLKAVTASDLQRGKAGGFAPAKLVEAAFKTAKDVPGSAAGDQETTRFVFRGHRGNRSAARSDRCASRSPRRCRILMRTISSAPMSRTWKRISASPSTSRRSTRSSAAAPRNNSAPTSQSYADRAVAKRIRGNATAAASRRWCGRRWSPTWRRRSPPFSSSAAASR